MRELKLVLMAIFVAVFVMGCGGSKTTDPDFSPDTPTMDLNYGEDTPDDDQAEPREDLVADEAEPEVEDSDEADTYTPPEPGTFGYPCKDGNDCHSNFCVDTPTGSVCTTTCVADCPQDWACKMTSVAGDPISICMPIFLTQCDPCVETRDCNSDMAGGTSLCLDMGNIGKFCAADCSIDGYCPKGYFCKDITLPGGAVANHCVPEDDAECVCSVRAINLGASTVCHAENEHGRCPGERRCSIHGLSECNAKTPRPEACNGVDDNCNGLTDEGLERFPCEKKNEFGTCEGFGFCSNGTVIDCDAREPQPELCNGIDDNCNGQTDEDLCYDGKDCTRDTCVPGATPEEYTCVYTPIAGPCDDLNPCTIGDRCDDQGNCLPGSLKNCDDLNPCTDDFCDPGTGNCVHTYNSAPCEDGNFCTQNDYCLNGACRSGTTKNCLDDNPCTKNERCNPATGECDWDPADGVSCDDQDPCTVNDVCSGGKCIGPDDFCEGTVCQPQGDQVICTYSCVVVPFIGNATCPCLCL
ncbi:MAG TPA: MopE-related protein [Myxococcota bacterium]|nr:MopE-related protein [Myxococcota bacterium]HQL56920.1 MopE-related protein [Myxococcota bacterium]